MKKSIIVAAFAAGIMVIAGCAGVGINEGFAVPMGGAIYADVKAPTFLQEKAEGNYSVVKSGVTAEARIDSYFAIVALGDASYETLKAEALKSAPGADELVDISVDFAQRNIIGINFVTVKLTATAVKMKK